MIFGGQTVTFVTLVGTDVYDEFGIEETAPSGVEVTGCRHRPLSAQEATEAFGNVATQAWKTTAPPEAAVVAAKSTGVLMVDGIAYQIIGGAQTFSDMGGNPFKVTILSKIQTV